MKTALISLLFAPPALLRATSCAGPASLAEALAPDSAVFVGSVAAIERRQWTQQVTFAVHEILWGIPGSPKTLTLLDSEHSYREPGRRFVISPRTPAGGLEIGACQGTVVKADHPWAAEFRRYVNERALATVPGRVISFPDYAAVESAEVTLTAGGRSFRQSASGQGRLSFEKLPPGVYSVTVKKEGYSQVESGSRISVLPGARALATFRIEPTSRIHGRILDHFGLPVANVSGFDLVGWDPPGQFRDYPRSRTFETGPNGEFSLRGTVPGVYYLGANIWGQNHPKRCPLPQVLYPGVPDFRNAALIQIRAGEVREIVFHLPDPGKKRRVTIRAAGVDGKPVAGADLDNGPARPDERPMAAIVETKTGEDGTAVLDLWCSMEYSIDVRRSGAGYAPLIRVPPGDRDITIEVRFR